MSDAALYFPTIRVPNNAWFLRVLLYWDSVGSIVPLDFSRDPERLGTYMCDLIQAGLVRPILPRFRDRDIPTFNRNFLRLVDEYTERDGGVSQIHFDKFPKAHIHSEKIANSDLLEELASRGLATREARDSWHEVQLRTANLYMAYLAVILGNQEGNMEPVTDRFAHLTSRPANSRIRDIPPEVIRNAGRITLLEGFFPAPNEPVSIAELVSFKERHQQLLANFKQSVDDFLLAASRLDDTHREFEIVRFKATQLEVVEEIYRRMKERRWRQVGLGSLSLLGGAMGIAAGVAENSTLNVWAAALSTLGSTGYLADEIDRRRELHDHPMAYVAEVIGPHRVVQVEC